MQFYAMSTTVTMAEIFLKGTEETPHHLFRECLGAWQTRRELLGHYCFDDVDYNDWEPKQLLEFFKHFDLENKPN